MYVIIAEDQQKLSHTAFLISKYWLFSLTHHIDSRVASRVIDLHRANRLVGCDKAGNFGTNY